MLTKQESKKRMKIAKERACRNWGITKSRKSLADFIIDAILDDKELAKGWGDE